MADPYGIRIHPLPAVYEYFSWQWVNSSTYRMRQPFPQARDDRLHICLPGTWGEGFCDCYGNVIVHPIYDSAAEYHCGISVVRCDTPPLYRNRLGEPVHRLFGGIDRDGRIVIPMDYEWLDDMVAGAAPACREGKWGMIDTRGAVLAPFVYDHIITGHGGNVYYYDVGFPLVAQKGGLYGCLGRDGREVVPCAYGLEAAREAGRREMGRVAEDAVPQPSENAFPYEPFHLGPYHFIRADFQKPALPDYHTIHTADPDADVMSWAEYRDLVDQYELAMALGRHKTGLADADGTLVLPPEYEDIRYARGEGPAGMTARCGDRWFFIELVGGKGPA